MHTNHPELSTMKWLYVKAHPTQSQPPNLMVGVILDYFKLLSASKKWSFLFKVK